MSRAFGPRFRRGCAAIGLALALFGSAQAAILDNSIALDAVYIPALSLTNAKPGDTAAAAKARAAMQRLDAEWLALRAALLKDLSGKTPAQAAAARKTLAQVDQALAEARKAMAAGHHAVAHTALEDVRIDLMKLRTAQGVDYFMDRLTAFHEPMEVLALAGSTLKPQDLTPAKRAEMEKTYAEARALWRRIEQNLPDPKAYQLSEAQQAQFNKGMADVTQALSRLSDALRGADNAALLKAAAAIKPPFARTFTAFGRYT
jgi:uncharacterized protein YukE